MKFQLKFILLAITATLVLGIIASPKGYMHGGESHTTPIKLARDSSENNLITEVGQYLDSSIDAPYFLAYGFLILVMAGFAILTVRYLNNE